MNTKLAEILRELLDLPAETPAESLDRRNFPEWDSLRHVKLMLELQKAFGVKFSAAEIMSLDSYAAILAALQRK